MMKKVREGFFIALLTLPLAFPVYASVGTEGAAFLEIPVGARPAALGGSYSALANDAYAPVLNPAGLGFLNSTELAGQHLSYISPNYYEFGSFVHPLSKGKALGVSAQYFTTGDIPGTNLDGSSFGTFSNHYGAYALAYGQAVTDSLALGASAKWINAALADVSANAYAADLGALFKASESLSLAATLTNMGTNLKFLQEGDPLPMEGHLGAAYKVSNSFLLTAEGVYGRNSAGSGHFGMEWRPIEMVALRTGYRTDTLKGLSPLAGLTTGVGLNIWGQEFSYAWLPMGDLGNTQYFSLLIKFGVQEEEKKNMIQYQEIKTHRTVKRHSNESQADQATEPEYQQLMQLLNESDTHTAQNAASPVNPSLGVQR
jgi:hypothetical protein